MYNKNRHELGQTSGDGEGQGIEDRQGLPLKIGEDSLKEGYRRAEALVTCAERINIRENGVVNTFKSQHVAKMSQGE